MEIIVLPTPTDVARAAADRIADIVARTPTAVIGLATGSSPQLLYADLAHRVSEGHVSFAQARGFALDEYVGIPLEHPESYASVIARDVITPLGFDPSRVTVPDGRADDLDAAAEAYDQSIAAAGGIDVQILGIGTNGHIGFNEPTSSFASRTRVKTLAPQTRADNARFFSSPDDVPRHCVTQGLGTILEARRLLLVATGETKADAVAATVEGPLQAFVPATALQLHRDTTVIVDTAAASRLRWIDYYTYTHSHRSEVEPPA